MEVFDREKWLKEDCVFTNNESCAACPYVVSDETGYFKCDKKMYEDCARGALDNNEFKIVTPYSKDIYNGLVKLQKIRDEIVENMRKEQRYILSHDELWGTMDEFVEAYHNVSNGHDRGQVVVTIICKSKNGSHSSDWPYECCDCIEDYYFSNDSFIFTIGDPKSGIYPEIRNGKLYWEDPNSDETLYWSDEDNSYILYVEGRNEIDILGFIRVVSAQTDAFEDIG